MRKNVIPGLNEFPVGGWVSPPPAQNGYPDYNTPENYRVMRESGINFTYSFGSEFEKSLDNAEKANVKLLVSDYRLADPEFPAAEGEALLKSYIKSPAFGGINACDEPPSTFYKRIETCRARYAELLGDSLYYVNLLPTYALQTALNGTWKPGDDVLATLEDYEEYIKGFADMVGSRIISYDFYPFRQEKGWMDTDYFNQLSLGRKYARRNGVPLWDFIQVTSWNRDGIRNMTYSEILWQVTTSLAYGVQGIQYFTYWTPLDAGGESFLDAMIDRDGNPAESYYFVREVNTHLHACGPRLLECEHVGLMVSGKLPAEVPECDLVKSFGVTVEGDAVLTGCFKKGGKKVIYPVNCSLFEARPVKLNFGGEKRLLIIKGDTTRREKAAELTLVLQPGEGVYVEQY